MLRAYECWLEHSARTSRPSGDMGQHQLPMNVCMGTRREMMMMDTHMPIPVSCCLGFPAHSIRAIQDIFYRPGALLFLFLNYSRPFSNAYYFTPFATISLSSHKHRLLHLVIHSLHLKKRIVYVYILICIYPHSFH